MKFWKLSSLISLAVFTLFLTPANLAAQEETANTKKPQHHHYKLIDLGTFGGPGSGVFDSQRELTRNGAVAGVAETATPDPYAPNCFDQDCLVEHGFLWQDGGMTDLGALVGVNNSQAQAINVHGLIVGQSQNGLIDPYLGIPATDGVAWANGEIFDLGTLGGYQSSPLDVNDAGQVAGASTNSIPDQYSFLSGTQTRAFLFENGSMRDLGTLGGPDAFGQFINERGQVAGFSYTSSMPGPGGVPPCDPFLWDKESGMKDLGNFGGTTCDLTFKATPFHLNNRGELVGGMMTVGDATYHPFLWDGKKMIDLGTLSGDIGRANWINEASDAVGNSAYADGRLRGVLWQDHKKIEDLGTLPGDNCSDAQTINDAGRIVGTSFSYTMMGNNDGCHYASTQITSQHAVLWEDGTIIDLNTVIQPNATLTLVEAKYINDRGEIAGMGIPPGVPVSDFEFHGHVFLLTTVRLRALGIRVIRSYRKT
jgi:probable HAF family extracellular repeat protein